MIVTIRPAVATLAASFERSGATVPAALAKALTRRTEAVDRFAARPLPAADALPVAVLGCLEAGVDPATDPTVRQIITAQGISSMHNLAADIEGILLDAIRATAIACTPAILTAWGRPFDKAARSLTEAHGVLGGVGLDDTTAIVKLGPDAATAWATAHDALGIIDAIVSGWLALYELTNRAIPHKSRRLNLIADIDAKVWIDHELDNSALDAWFAVGSGYDLRLCTVQDYSRRIAAIDTELRQRTDADNRRAHDAATGRIVNV